MAFAKAHNYTFPGTVFTAFLLMGMPVGTFAPACWAQGAPATEAEQLDFASGLLQRGMYSMASAEYEKFLAQYPNSAELSEVHYGIAECLFFEEKYPEAVAAYSKYLEANPAGSKIAVAKLRLAQAAFFQGQFDQAVSLFASVDPNSLSPVQRQTLFFYTAKTHRSMNNLDTAIEIYHLAVAVDESKQFTIPALMETAEIFVQLKKFDEAIAEYAKIDAGTEDKSLKAMSLYKQGEVKFVAGRYQEATDTFKNVMALYPDQDISVDAMANLLSAWTNLKNFEQVIVDYNNYQKKISESSKYFNVFMIVGSAYSQMSRFDDALSMIEKILEFKDLTVEQKQKAMLAKTETLLRAQRFDQVNAWIDAQLASAETNKDQIYFLKAEAFYGMKQYPQAMEWYQKITQEFPESSFAVENLYGMAHTQYAQDKLPEAMELFRQYFDKSSDALKKQQALNNEILIANQTNNTARAIERSELFLTTFPGVEETPDILFQLGTFYAKQQDFVKAAEKFRQFADGYPQSNSHTQAVFLLAYNLQRAQKYDEALLAYQGIPSDTSDRKIYYSSLKNMALIYVEKKDDAKAAELYDKIITDFNNNDLELKPYVWLGEKYLKDKNYEGVLRIMDQAKSVQKGPLPSDISFLRGEAYRGKGEWQKAVDQYDEVIKAKEPSQYKAAALIAQGQSFKQLNQFDKAKEIFEQTVKEFSDDNTVSMQARFEIAAVEQQNNKLEEAAKYYMLVAVLYNDAVYCPQSLLKAGEIFEQLKKMNEAAQAYQEILTQYGQSEFASQAKQRLEGIQSNAQ